MLYCYYVGVNDVAVLLQLDREGGGVEADTHTKIFSNQCGGHPQPMGVKSPNHPANRTLMGRLEAEGVEIARC